MFILPFEVSKAPFSLSVKDKLLLIGSCFAENIGSKLVEYKFKAITNPFGIIYNPISLLKILDQSLAPQVDPDRIIEIDHIYYYWDAHSTLSDPSKDMLQKKLQEQYQSMRTLLSRASTLVISLGTGWVYRHYSSDDIVANCHKIPGKEFNKTLLSVEEITKRYFEVMKTVRSYNPALKVILTVSPVRHVKDGLIENNQSKSRLIQAVHEITAKDPQASYFPSYEIMIDVLRDYRFYKEDMIHPNDQAIDYIWKAFSSSYFDQETQDFISEWEKLTKALNHRPFHPNSPAHQSFLRSTAKKLQSMAEMVDVEKELNAIQKQLLDS